MADKPDNKPKEYSLKPVETELLNVIMQQQNTLLSNVISFIALERLAYDVTPNTKFNLEDNFTKLTISEVEAPAEDKAGDVIEQATK